MSSDREITGMGASVECENLALEASNLSKIYHLYNAPSDRLKQIIWGGRRQYYKEFTALQGVSFSLPKGEVLGLVGRNGAGKSTLLQLICGTLSPSSGRLQVNGRIAALLELGAGFNPQFTGRENIYLAAMVMGVSRQEVDEKLESIIDFSGIRPFIDQPVSTYSSGMYVRLAFSVATSVEPEVLIIDEALSVGDGDFARRSFERIMAMRDAGATILFCSHSLYQVEVLCTQAIWLEAGQVQARGTPAEVIPQYQSFLDRLGGDLAAEAPVSVEAVVGEGGDEPVKEKDQDKPKVPEASSVATGARLTAVTAGSGDSDDGKLIQMHSGDALQLDIEFQVSAEILADGVPQVAVAIHSAGGQLVSSCGCWAQGVSPDVDEQGCGRIRLSFDRLPLLKGTYYVGALLFCPKGIFLHDEADPALTLQISQSGQERGLVYLDHCWRQSKPQRASRWRAVDAGEVPQSALLSLFKDVFGCEQSEELWRWKYRYAHSPGSVVLDGDRPVAFNGAIPRPGWVFGRPEALIQMGDVMAAKEVRGILTRKGPFFLAVEHYLTRHVGPHKRHSIAFGFPNDRACRVGIRKGLYCDIDRVSELSWPPQHSVVESAESPDARQLSPEVVQNQSAQKALVQITLDNLAEHQPTIERLWCDMRDELSDAALGCRDVHWLRHRYLDKPGADYRLYLVKASSYIGVIVMSALRESSEGLSELELMDLVAPRSSVSGLVAAAQNIAAQAGADRLFAWATPKAQSWFAESNPNVNALPVVIPGNALALEHSLRVKNSWWLMGGDTDFR